ncbi:MAG TPA: hypothetical protein VMR77_01890 [Patescibacteria group bacterium]|jgi:hypothetical protein|nr:hypothetical protein [Patescibacteria group bacterium]
MLRLTKTQIINALKVWIPLAIVATGLSGLIYLAVQQDLRIGANDPQIQIAEDVARQISTGENPLAFIPPIKVEVSQSLANYIVIFDAKGNIIGSSAVLDGKELMLPSGVFTSAKNNGETRFTWQPRAGIRSAVVMNYYKGLNTGYVLVGRSMREIEKKIDHLGLIIFLGWLVTLGTSLIAVLILQKAK